MDAGSDHGSAAKGSAIDLEVAGSGLVSCCFPFPPLPLPCVVYNLVFHKINKKAYIQVYHNSKLVHHKKARKNLENHSMHVAMVYIKGEKCGMLHREA